ncbi:MAG: aminodeoxychorismate lyase [Methylococcales bacterium]
MVLINGKREHSLDVTDRGLQYGDGLFETLAVNNGQVIFLHEHLQRLKQGCERLLIPCPELDLLKDEVIQLVENTSQAVLKIIVTRGSGGRGYRQPDRILATRILSLHPYPDYPLSFKQQGVVIRFCRMRLGLNPSLAGIKHLNRLEQVLARAEWQDPGIQEGLMSDALDRVIEGTMSNLFFIKDQALVTSPLTFSGVDGIIRQQVMQLATLYGISIREMFFNREILLAAEEVFLTNSIIGIWPVRQLEQQLFSLGGITQKLMTGLERSP